MQTRKQTRRPRRKVLRIPIRMAAGAGALALVLAGCGGDGGTDGKGAVAATAGPTPSVKRTLALVDDTQSMDAAGSVGVDVLDNDSVTLESGAGAALLDAYDPAELALTIDRQPEHGSASVSGATVTYTARDGYDGEDALTYRVEVEGAEVPAASAVLRITVGAPAPERSPDAPPASKPAPKATVPAAVHYENCDAARTAGAAPVEEGDPGYAPHLDRDGDGVGCEPWGEASSPTGGNSDGGGGTGGGGSVSYANCAAVRDAGAAPIRAGDPGYGRHLDRDGDGIACE
ncbi:excalibur calcium-binding domain-containing protein [Streptomyces sp. V2I9]|uniref:excalibur calcium-binding domain-containing protein n=1 Tax=Streptomyces sp. V2I9 TaxID=3042304 RepID=UPI0027837C4B|nr:excalibur calcium-binding domain-containing protein [Streptomyces sp. V2I9]MDQ0984704.1 hypothetical protein [Streptomyces sp. V2I9]